ncbi:VOC family protein [Aureimonas leprariae]|uniref:Extradiol dioxygenase n=1 Tax=Plantimonas leprariae TaxID=2615207 RepID=A0A7V7TYI0_9HYPH|nr:VOC family protein [Aureimonas leprariae]KAB0677341.1 extradiol dioxygenase [Aureimonas leprariae]
MSTANPALHHLNIKTRRLNEMVDWYATVVGASVQFRNDYAAWMTNDGANHRIAFLSPPGLVDDPDKRRHAGLHHSAFEFESFDHLVASYERLRDLGIAPAVCLDHGMTVSMYYCDPDENFVELQSDIFGDWRASSEWMRTTLAFQDNPIGTFFDPEPVCRAHREGQDYGAIRQRILSGEFAPEREPDLGLSN